jgi:hypothetical protein
MPAKADQEGGGSGTRKTDFERRRAVRTRARTATLGADARLLPALAAQKWDAAHGRPVVHAARSAWAADRRTAVHGGQRLFGLSDLLRLADALTGSGRRLLRAAATRDCEPDATAPKEPTERLLAHLLLPTIHASRPKTSGRGSSRSANVRRACDSSFPVRRGNEHREDSSSRARPDRPDHRPSPRACGTDGRADSTRDSIRLFVDLLSRCSRKHQSSMPENTQSR